MRLALRSPSVPAHPASRALDPRLFVCVALLLLTIASSPALAQAAPSSERIPEIHAATLAGQTVDLPAQLRGRVGVLILGFSKSARAPVTDWGRRLAVDYATSSTVSYFEMPVLASVPRLLRGLVLKQIAADVSDRAKPHFVAITADEPHWRALVHYSRPDDAYLLVVDENGAVRATQNGPLTDAAYANLQRAMAAATASHTPVTH